MLSFGDVPSDVYTSMDVAINVIQRRNTYKEFSAEIVFSNLSDMLPAITEHFRVRTTGNRIIGAVNKLAALPTDHAISVPGQHSLVGTHDAVFIVQNHDEIRNYIQDLIAFVVSQFRHSRAHD
jgi:hypothetical protein